MSDFHATWSLVRGRFDDAVLGLRFDQLGWRLHPGALTLGEMAIHVAGVEIWFVSQLLDEPLEGDWARAAKAATDGSVNDLPFPFRPEEITPDWVAECLAEGRRWVEPVMLNLTDDLRSRQIVSALGPVIDGTGAMARLAYHPGYHQGQAYLIKSAPGFPA